MRGARDHLTYLYVDSVQIVFGVIAGQELHKKRAVFAR